MDSAARFLKGFDPAPNFPLLADIGRTRTGMLDRTTAYLIDRHGTIRQVFPMLIHSRPSLDAILGEVSRLQE